MRAKESAQMTELLFYRYLVALANNMGILATVDDLKADTLKKVLDKMEK